MRKHMPAILSFLILVFPIFYIGFCIVNNRIIADKMVVVQFGLFFIVLLISSKKSMSYVVKTVISATILFLVFWGSLVFHLLGGSAEFMIFEDEAVDNFESSFFVYPENYKNAQGYRYSDNSFFAQDSGTIILKFDEKDFIKAKSDITRKHQFYTEKDFNGEINPEFEYAKFDFSICKSDKYFPQVIYFIGFNNESGEIAFVWLNDLERDGVSEFEGLLSFDCGWKYIDKSRNNTFFKFCYKTISE